MLCECGCGSATKIATKTDARRGHVKGKPQRFLLGHRNQTRGDAHHLWRGGVKVTRNKLTQSGYHRRYYQQRVKDGVCPACGLARDSKFNLCSACRLRCRSSARKLTLRTKFSLSISDYNELLQKQGGVCAICLMRSTSNSYHKNLAVDHDHKTGRIRGLLCMRCNTALGAFNDDRHILQRAIVYLGSPCVS